MLLASHTDRGTHGGWYVALAIGFAVVVVVVIVVAAILQLAGRIGAQAREGTGALDDARDATLWLWDVQHARTSVNRILDAARTAREVLRRA